MLRTVRLAAAAITCAAALALYPVVRAQDAPPSALLKEFAWRSIGPVNMGGRVDDVEAVDGNPAVIYVGTAASGVWKTDNNGTTWIPVFDREPNQSIGDIAIAPSNPNIVWVGTGEANSRQSTSYGHGLYKSTDAGTSWAFMGLPDSSIIGRIVIDPKNPDVVYVAAVGDLFKAHPERGLYKTVDGGKTWAKSKFIDDDTGFIDVAMDPSNSQVLIAASYQRRRTAWGFNGGGPGSALWKTIDAGKTWKKIEAGGLPAYGQWGRAGLAFARSNPNVVYAMIEPGPQPGGGAPRPAAPDPNLAGIWRSDDKGVTWKLTSNENGRAMYFSQVRVDPKDPNTIFLLERNLYKSVDGGRTFASIQETLLTRLQEPRLTTNLVTPFDRGPADALPPSHPDHHAMWIDPGNPKHILLGHDGGVDFSYDGGRTWQLQNAMPMGQFYAVAVDMRQPYYVYGGAQDNGAWGGPSRVRNNGGITREHWFELAAGDGYHVQADPTDWATVYASVSGNGGQHVYRFNLRTGEQKYIRPTPPRAAAGGRGAVALPLSGNIVNAGALAPNEVLRFNWNPGFAMSPHDPRVLYFGAQRLFKSYDRGDSWVGTKDLTKALDRDTLSIMSVPGSRPMTSKNDGVAQWGTIVTIAESPVTPRVVWVGTDDGNLQVSEDEGGTWSSVADHAATFATNYYVSAIQPSNFDAGTAYAAFDGHRSGDYKPYVFRTTDYGKTWTNLSIGLPPHGHVNVVREDRVNRNLLFVGTESGFYISLDAGKSWSPFMRDLPATISNDVLVHPRDQDLVLATHGRSFYVLDDITALQQLTGEVLEKTEHLFRPRPATLWDEDKQAWHGGGDEQYRAKNPPDAIVSYYLKAAVSGPVKVQIADATGAVVRELDGPSDAGIHRVAWDLRKLPAAADMPGERIAPGTYGVRLVANGKATTASLTVLADPNR